MIPELPTCISLPVAGVSRVVAQRGTSLRGNRPALTFTAYTPDRVYTRSAVWVGAWQWERTYDGEEKGWFPGPAFERAYGDTMESVIAEHTRNHPEWTAVEFRTNV